MLAVGLMSGTSLDGIDAALVDITGVDAETKVFLRAFATYPFSEPVRARIREACAPGGADARLISSLNMELGQLFSNAVGRICAEAGVAPGELGFVATHGQTIWHEPGASRAYADGARYHAGTLQIGEPACIAYDHNVRVVSDFRVMDIVAGGQGAPLVPFSEVVLYRSDTRSRALLNVGGIANVTVLPRGCSFEEVFAFDTGPGNMMVDEACRRLFGIPFDEGGRIAASGAVDAAALAWLRENPYLEAEPPKSTGRELFGAAALDAFLAAHPALAPADAVATLTEFTAVTVADACMRWVVPALEGALDELVVGGGGAHNATLVARLAAHLPGVHVCTQEELGFSSDAKEAVAFAVLGNQTLAGRPSNVPAATGAHEAVVLGSVTMPPRAATAHGAGLPVGCGADDRQGVEHG